MTQTHRVLIVEDHPLVLGALKDLLRGYEDFNVVAEAGDAGTALKLVQEDAGIDLLLLDLNLPGGVDGAMLAREITRLRPEARILFLSMHHEPELVKRAMQAGGLGYIVKTSPSEEIIRALRAVAQGQRFLGSGISLESEPTHQFSDLTDREIEVARLLPRGMSSKDIAQHLGISPRTVETHRLNIMRKTATKNTPELIAKLKEAAWI